MKFLHSLRSHSGNLRNESTKVRQVFKTVISWILDIFNPFFRKQKQDLKNNKAILLPLLNKHRKFVLETNTATQHYVQWNEVGISWKRPCPKDQRGAFKSMFVTSFSYWWTVFSSFLSCHDDNSVQRNHTTRRKYETTKLILPRSSHPWHENSSSIATSLATSPKNPVKIPHKDNSGTAVGYP